MKRWLGIGLSLILLASLLLYVGPQIERAIVVDMLAATSLWAVVAAILLLWLNFAISTERYRLILGNMPVRSPGFVSLYCLTFMSLLLSHFVAIGPAADVVRVGYGRLKLALPMVTVIESVVYDRVLALAGLSILGLILLPLQIVRGVPEVLWLSQLAVWLVSLGGILFVTWGARATSIQRIPFLAGVIKSVAGFLPAVSGRGSVPLQLLLAVGYGGSYGLTIWVLALGMGLSPDVLDILQFSPFILLVQSMPVFYVGWGARETVMVGLLGMAGVLSSEQALFVSVATGVVFFLAALPGAVVWLRQPDNPKPT